MAGFMKLQVWREPMTLRFDPEAGEPRFVPRSEAHGYDDLPPEVTADGHAEPNIGGEGSTAYFARYSAPGYMDKTDTSGPYNKATDAALEVFRLYGETGEGDDDLTSDEQECVDMLVSFGMTEAAARNAVAE